MDTERGQLAMETHTDAAFVDIAGGSDLLIQLTGLGTRKYPGTMTEGRSLRGSRAVRSVVKHFLGIHSGCLIIRERDLEESK